MSTEDTTTKPAIRRVSLAGEQHALVLPDFCVRDELLSAWGAADGRTMRQLRVSCALLGCCTRLGSRSGKTYADCHYDALAYGGHVYDYLRRSGVEPSAMMQAGVDVLGWLVEHLAPRESEVKERTGFSEGGGAESTAPPSA